MLALIAGLLLAVAGPAAAAVAATPAHPGSAAGDSPTSPVTYGFNDTTQYFTVPFLIQQLNITAWGGSGGAGAGTNGGLGAQISETVNVTPGEILVITTGGQGGTAEEGPGGAGGLSSGNPMNGGAGGTGPTTTIGAGGGGGGTEVDVNNGPTLVAAGSGGGGGGGGYTYDSFGGGGGNAGTTSAGGNGGGEAPGTGGPAASEFVPGGGAGQDGDSLAAGGGGGGGGGFSAPSDGLYGGGAGGTAGTDVGGTDQADGGGGGGGAGASYTNPSATNVSMTNGPAGNGGVVISWATPPPAGVSFTFSLTPAQGVVVDQDLLVDVNLTAPAIFGQVGPSGGIFIYDEENGAGGGGNLAGTNPDGYGVYIPMTAPGPQTIVMEYDGDANFNGFTATTTVDVLAASAVTVSSNASTVRVGKPVTITAAVTNGTSTPATGAVSFYDGTTANLIGSANLNAATPDVATLTTKALAAGTHQVFAVYGGDSADAGSQSATISVVVKPAAPGVGGVDPGAGPAGTTVTVNGNHLAGATRLLFGKQAATSFSCSATTCTAVAPAGSGTVDVRVVTAGGTSPISASDKFSYSA